MEEKTLLKIPSTALAGRGILSITSVLRIILMILQVHSGTVLLAQRNNGNSQAIFLVSTFLLFGFP
jgi:hypothetical protein